MTTCTGSSLSNGGGPGQPSRVDFELYELPRIFRDVADRWEDLFQPIPGRPDYRTFISVGVLVPALSVDAQLGRDGVIELLSLDVDRALDLDDTEDDE